MATDCECVGMPVELYIYDLSNGLASVLGPALIGQPIEGVWHTAVVVYGREYFYGAGGITDCPPGGTQLGPPLRVERLGETFVSRALFLDYLRGLSSTSYHGNNYHLLEHNCNHFSEELAQFLCGAHVPKHILQQPAQLPPQLRLAVTAMLENMLPAPSRQAARGESPDYLTLNTQIEQARAEGAALEARRSTLADKLARKEKRREKKRLKVAGPPPPADTDMAEAVAVELEAPVAAPRAGPSAREDPDEARERELRRREADPPIVYTDIDPSTEYEKLAGALAGADLSPEERQSLDELQQYLVQGEGSWVLGDDFLAFIGRILTDEALAVARAAALRCLACCALREDVSLVLHQDRRHHALLSAAQRVDRLPPPEQHALALFMCNLFENVSSSEWLLYISEWQAGGQTLSNIRATTKVCVHAALSEDEDLRELGTALMHNVATKEVKTVRLGESRALRDLLPRRARSKVFDEVCVELVMALLQLLAWSPREEHLWRALKALGRLARHSQDVPQLIAMLGPDPATFRGTSTRVDEQIDLIVQTLK